MYSANGYLGEKQLICQLIVGRLRDQLMKPGQGLTTMACLNALLDVCAP